MIMIHDTPPTLPTTVGRSNSSVEGFISAKYFSAIPFILQIFRASWGASDIWVMEAFLLLFLRDVLMMSFREICWMQIFSNYLFLRYILQISLQQSDYCTWTDLKSVRITKLIFLNSRFPLEDDSSQNPARKFRAASGIFDCSMNRQW